MTDSQLTNKNASCSVLSFAAILAEAFVFVCACVCLCSLCVCALCVFVLWLRAGSVLRFRFRILGGMCVSLPDLYRSQVHLVCTLEPVGSLGIACRSSDPIQSRAVGSGGSCGLIRLPDLYRSLVDEMCIA